MNRVVVTGMGAVTPLGCKVNTFLENIENGVCGISEITKFDTSEFTVKFAGEVKDFAPQLRLWRTASLFPMKI